ncbi:MAG: fatty acid desaturase family protein [Proteobacteria bacterium]|nr:fatty acid desaturase family protein [Pseudomonadota bacterium]
MIIAAAVAFAVYFPSFWAWLGAAVVIATRQHALLILMHEASHRHLFTSRPWSELVSDILCAFPMNITTLGYKHEHLAHHRHTNTPNDPYWVIARNDPATWQFPKSWPGTVRVLVGDCIALHIPRHLAVVWPWTYPARLLGKALPRLSAAEHVRYWGYVAVAATALTLASGWIHYFVLWLLPSLTIMMALFRIRALAEHPYTRAGADELLETRRVDGPLWQKFLFAPLNINYHLEHHLFPSVPYYNLPRLGAELQHRGVYRTGKNYFFRYLGTRDSAMAFLMSRDGGDGRTQRSES